jgi:hypothetical protein
MADKYVKLIGEELERKQNECEIPKGINAFLEGTKNVQSLSNFAQNKLI